MSGFICVKGITLSGVEYLPGEPIPEDAVLPGRVGILIGQNYIAKADFPASSTELTEENKRLQEEISELSAKLAQQNKAILQIPVYWEAEAEPKMIELTTDESICAFTMLQLFEQHAVDAIAEIETEELLMLIHRLDSREAVKEAARNRAMELNPDITPVRAQQAPEESDETSVEQTPDGGDEAVKEATVGKNAEEPPEETKPADKADSQTKAKAAAKSTKNKGG